MVPDKQRGVTTSVELRGRVVSHGGRGVGEEGNISVEETGTHWLGFFILLFNVKIKFENKQHMRTSVGVVVFEICLSLKTFQGSLLDPEAFFTWPPTGQSWDF